ncbi:MAG: hypothetical protein GY820_22270 [Gammaproteobacteria bacterium]|nr:hypothetical protein [Gammaproteobacteria bacterium]
MSEPNITKNNRFRRLPIRFLAAVTGFSEDGELEFYSFGYQSTFGVLGIGICIYPSFAAG